VRLGLKVSVTIIEIGVIIVVPHKVRGEHYGNLLYIF